MTPEQIDAALAPTDPERRAADTGLPTSDPMHGGARTVGAVANHRPAPSVLDIDADLALCDAATRGPWWWDGLRVQTLIGVGGDREAYAYATDVLYVEHDGGCGCRKACEMTMELTEADAAFIAAARIGWPEALHAIQRVLALCNTAEAMGVPHCTPAHPQRDHRRHR